MDELIAALDPYADRRLALRSARQPQPQHHAAPRPHRAPRRPSRSPPSAPTTQRSADYVAPSVAPSASAPPPGKPGHEDDGASPPVPPPRSPRKARRVEVVEAPPLPPARGFLFAVAAVALVVGALGTWRALRVFEPVPLASASGGAASAVVAAPTATAVTDLPDPRTTSPEALAAYRSGLAELRFGGTRDALERATALDPSLAAAHLQCAVDASEYDLDDTARAHLRKAVGAARPARRARPAPPRRRSSRVLLRQPADWAEAGRRLAARRRALPPATRSSGTSAAPSPRRRAAPRRARSTSSAPSRSTLATARR